MKAVAYLRRSTSKQALSIDRQRMLIEEWARDNGANVIAWHVEQPTSRDRSPSDRPAMQAALDDVAEHGADLIVDEASRLGSGLNMAGWINYTVSQAGARVIAVDGSATGDENIDALVSMLRGWVAAQELASLRRRTRTALRLKRERGEQVGHDAPYGWMHHDGMRIENPDEQPILSRILSRHESGQTAYRIAKDLQAEGVPSRGGRWHTNTVRRILKRHGERTAS